jgi:hypothetical protein
VAHAAVDSDSSSCDAGASAEDDTSSSVVTLSSCSDSNKGGTTQQLLDDVTACCSSSSTQLLSGVSDSASAADAAGEPLLTAVSSTSHARAAWPVLPHKQQQPVRLPAPVRSRAAPVAVAFTQLETPHLPAREQREVEIKAIKRHAGQVCSC